MTENENGNNEKKPQIEYHAPPVEDFNSTDYLVTRISVGTGISDDHPNRYDKFEIAFKRIKLADYESFGDALTDLEKTRGIKADLQNILDKLIQSLFTAPQYHTVLCYQEGEKGPDEAVITPDSEFYKTLKPEGHQAAQTMADAYVVGQRVVGVSQKKIIADVKAAEQEFDMNHDEMVAKLREMKEAGMLDD